MGMPHPSQPTMHIHACMCLYNSEKRDYYASPDSPPQVEGALMAWTYSAKSPSTYASRSSFLLSSSSQISPRSVSASLAQRASLAFNASRLPDRRGGGRYQRSFHATLSKTSLITLVIIYWQITHTSPHLSLPSAFLGRAPETGSDRRPAPAPAAWSPRPSKLPHGPWARSKLQTL